MKSEKMKSVHNRKRLIVCFNTVYMITGIILGSVLTKKAVQLADMERGYMAVGGEWLVFLIVLLIFDFVRKIFDFFISLIKTIREEDRETAEIIEFQSYIKKQRR